MLFFLNPVSHPVIINWTIYSIYLGFPGGLVVKILPANAGDVDSIPGLGRSPGKEMANQSCILPGKSHEQRSLMGYSPWGHTVRHD